MHRTMITFGLFAGALATALFAVAILINLTSNTRPFGGFGLAAYAAVPVGLCAMLSITIGVLAKLRERAVTPKMASGLRQRVGLVLVFAAWLWLAYNLARFCYLVFVFGDHWLPFHHDIWIEMISYIFGLQPIWGILALGLGYWLLRPRSRASSQA